MLNVLIVEDERLMQEGIEILLQEYEEIQVIGLASDGYEGVELAVKLRPDIVIMDNKMPNLSGIQASAILKERIPEIKIVLLTQQLDTNEVVRAVMAGIDGILLKEVYSQTLKRTLMEVYRGEVIFSGEVARRLASQIINQPSNSDKQRMADQLAVQGYRFTTRQLDILYLAMANHTNRRIAEMLQLTEGTVKNYMSTIYDKLGLHGRKAVSSYIQSIK